MPLKPSRFEDLSGLRVLAVDDHAIARQLTEAMLGAFGIRPDFAETGEEALERASRSRFDLALVDFGLPDIDGGQLATLLARTPGLAQAGFVAVTGLPRPAALPAPFAAWVEKPFSVRQLHDAVQFALAARPAGRTGTSGS